MMTGRGAAPSRSRAISACRPDDAQDNFTDPESRIMKNSDGFDQCYNGQVAVDAAFPQIIVATHWTNGAADQELNWSPWWIAWRRSARRKPDGRRRGCRLARTRRVSRRSRPARSRPTSRWAAKGRRPAGVPNPAAPGDRAHGRPAGHAGRAGDLSPSQRFDRRTGPRLDQRGARLPAKLPVLRGEANARGANGSWCVWL